MNGNEPTFPSYIEADKGQFSEAKGVTIRAWMATKMAAGILASQSNTEVIYENPKGVAKKAVAYADALIVELNDPQN